jgi:GAF domain-containing protein
MNSLSDAILNTGRLSSLLNSGLLDTPVEASFDRLTRLAATIIHTPIALVSLVDKDRQYFKSCFGLSHPWNERRETPLTHSFCKYIVESKQPLYVLDARTHPLVQKSLGITELGIISYAGVPLTMSDGEVIGTFCVCDHVPREWNSTELKCLADICESVMTEIELRLVIKSRNELRDMILHDVRGQIGAILLNCDLIKAKLPDVSKLETCLNRIKNSGSKIQAMIEGLRIRKGH